LKLSWQDLRRFAATYLDGLVARQRHDADTLLRDRVAALSGEERGVLRAVLDAAPA